MHSAAPTRQAGTRSADAAGTAQTGTLVYVYGVVEAGSAAHRWLGERRRPGLDRAGPLFPIEQGRLVAAASQVPASEFDEAPLNALVADLARLTPYTVRHAEVIDALFRHADALVPLTFGAVYRDPGRVADLLREHAADFQRLLDAVRSRQEWGVKVFAETARLVAAVEGASPVLRQLATEIAAATPGRAYLLRKRRERLAAEEVAHYGADALQRVLDRLSEVSAAIRQDELPPAVPGETVRLALKLACLVDAGAAEPFRAAVAELAEHGAAEGFQFDLTGPWAPYSFVGGQP